MPTIDVSKFNFITDADTLKNNGGETVTVTIPASDTITGSNFKLYSEDIEVDSENQNVIVYMENNKDSGKSYLVNVGASGNFTRTGTVSATPGFAYSLFPVSYRVGAETFRVGVLVPNPYGSTLTLTGSAEINTFKVRIFADTF